MFSARAGASIAALLMFGVVASWNWVILVRRLTDANYRVSWIPLVGAVPGIAGALISPWPSVQSLWWLALLLDGGSAPGLGLTVIWHAWRVVRASRQGDRPPASGADEDSTEK